MCFLNIWIQNTSVYIVGYTFASSWRPVLIVCIRNQWSLVISVAEVALAVFHVEADSLTAGSVLAWAGTGHRRYDLTFKGGDGATLFRMHGENTPCSIVSKYYENISIIILIILLIFISYNTITMAVKYREYTVTSAVYVIKLY